ncbi:MAG: tetratricopeptide repeat protein [Candidatus Atribacteria bacterium]|nr:tetratricopeptide repeat protein [Candidatus Atribacteria bacterium]
MKKRYLKMFLMLSLVICGLLSVFSFSFAAGQGQTAWETLSQEASDYLEMAINKMEEAIKTYQGANYPSRELWAEAIDYGERAIQADPDFIEAHYYLAQIFQYTNWYYREAREWERYIELIQKKEVISPEAKQKLSFAYYRLGYAAYQREDYDGSILYLQKAVEVNPEMTEAYYWLARISYEEGRLNDSLPSWQKVLEVDPLSPRAQYFYTKAENSIKYGKEAYSHYEAGYNLYEQRLFEEAIYEYRQAVRYNSDFSLAYYWLGRIYYEQGNYREAVSNWKEVLRLEPGNTKAEYWLKQAEKQLK